MHESLNWLNHDHLENETLLHDCQDAIAQEDWRAEKRFFDELACRVKVHMHIEEEVLYPAYESAVNVPQEPIQALREEHDEIV